jgi:hypothetical protein
MLLIFFFKWIARAKETKTLSKEIYVMIFNDTEIYIPPYVLTTLFMQPLKG